MEQFSGRNGKYIKSHLTKISCTHYTTHTNLFMDKDILASAKGASVFTSKMFSGRFNNSFTNKNIQKNGNVGGHVVMLYHINFEMPTVINRNMIDNDIPNLIKCIVIHIIHNVD